MSTINLLTCSLSYFVRSSLSQSRYKLTSCLSTGVGNFNKNFPSAHSQSSLTYAANFRLRFPAAGKPSTSVYDLTRLPCNSFSTKVPGSADKSSVSKQPDQTAPTTAKLNPLIDDPIFGECSNLSQFEKFKLMYKKYWYVLIPVHIASSIGWVAGFYYLSKSGVDIPSILQSIHISDTIIEKVKNSNMGHYAIAYLCYKIITPLRYAVSLGLTTISIKRLVLAGYIKPIPTKQEFIDMYEKKMADRAKRKDDEANAKSS